MLLVALNPHPLSPHSLNPTMTDFYSLVRTLIRRHLRSQLTLATRASDFQSAPLRNGKSIDFSSFKGKVVIIVNVASAWYAALSFMSIGA